MLHAVPQDRMKLEHAVRNILSHVDGERFIFVNHVKLYNDLKFSKLRRPQLEEEIADILASIKICRQEGIWLYTEYGGGYYVFCKISSKPSHSDDLIPQLVSDGQALDLSKSFIDDSEPEEDEPVRPQKTRRAVQAVPRAHKAIKEADDGEDEDEEEGFTSKPVARVATEHTRDNKGRMTRGVKTSEPHDSENDW